jgi:hypothetical protein
MSLDLWFAFLLAAFIVLIARPRPVACLVDRGRRGVR